MAVISLSHRNKYLRSLNATSISDIRPWVTSRHDQLSVRAISPSTGTQMHGVAVIAIVILVISGILAVLIFLYCILWSKKLKRDEKKALNLAENKEQTISFFLARGKFGRNVVKQDDFQMRVEAVLQAEKKETEKEAASNGKAIPQEQLYDKETGFRFVFSNAAEQNTSPTITVPPAVAISSESINSGPLKPIEKIPRIDSFKGLPPLQLPPPIIVLSGSRDSISRILVSPRQPKPEAGERIAQKTSYGYLSDDSSESPDLDSDTLSPGQSLLLDIASFPIPPQNTAWMESLSLARDSTSTTLSKSSTKYTETSRDCLLESFDTTRCSSIDDIKAESILKADSDEGSPPRDTILTAFEDVVEDPLSFSTSTESIAAKPESPIVENIPPRPVIESQPTFISLPRVTPQTNKTATKPTHTKDKMSIDLLHIKERADKRLEMKKQEMKIFLEECQKLDVRPFLDERRRAMMALQLERW